MAGLKYLSILSGLVNYRYRNSFLQKSFTPKLHQFFLHHSQLIYILSIKPEAAKAQKIS